MNKATEVIITIFLCLAITGCCVAQYFQGGLWWMGALAFVGALGQLVNKSFI